MNMTKVAVPTWSAMHKIILAVLENPETDADTRAEALKELQRMADVADKYVELMKNK